MFRAWTPSTAQSGNGGMCLNPSIQDLIQEEKTFTHSLLNSDSETRPFARVKKRAKKGRRQ